MPASASRLTPRPRRRGLSPPRLCAFVLTVLTPCPPFSTTLTSINGTTGKVNQAYIVGRSTYLYDWVYPSRNGDYNDACVTSTGEFYGQTEFGVNGTTQWTVRLGW